MGATGSQGTAAIKGLLQKGGYQIRALTRRPDSDAAKELKSRGMDIVQADANDEASLKSAFAGSHVIFAVTDFFELFAQHGAEEAVKLEVQQGKNIANVAEATITLEHFIWSTLPAALDRSASKITVPHYDGKNIVSKYVRTKPTLLSKTTFLLVGWYDSNFNYATFQPTPVATTGKYIVIGDYDAFETSCPTIGDVKSNLGPFVKAIVEQPEKTKKGAMVVATIGDFTTESLLQKWGKIHGKEVVYVKTDNATYNKLWPMWAEESSLMMRYLQTYKELAWADPVYPMMLPEELGIDTTSMVGLDESLKTFKF
ncbi:NmrA-like family-domain-containing protein [Xylogone sp. PMI_703]|nr:NmrA-like family-domain-containing protein [Xylogone sp. PMI_703]